MTDDRQLERLRDLCLGFPEARETTTFGNPTFQAGTKTFAVLDAYKGTRCLAFKVTPDEQDVLCQQERFFVAPYTGKNGWTCLRLEGKVDWAEARRLIERSYRLVALKRMLAALDGAPTPPARRRSMRLTEAVKQGLADAEAGRVHPHDTVVAEMKKRFRKPGPS